MRLDRTILISSLLMTAGAFTPFSSIVHNDIRTISFAPAIPKTLLPTSIVFKLDNNCVQDCETGLCSTSASASNQPSQTGPSLSTSLLSASIFLILDIAFRRGFKLAAIEFPSSLAGCLALFASLLVVPNGDHIFDIVKPGADLLAKWLPVFFVPSLITFPLVGGMGSATEVLKVLFVIVGGFYFTLLTTAISVVGVRKLFQPPAASVGKDEQKLGNDEPTIATGSTPAQPKAYSDEVSNTLRLLTGASGVAAVGGSMMGSSLSQSLVALFMLSTTLHNFVFGARLPKKFTKVVHPLVTCTTLTWIFATAFATATGSTFKAMLKGYRTGVLSPFGSGAGDILLFLLGPSVVSLGVSMYDRRKLMRQNIKEVATAVAVSAFGGLFGTAAAVRALRIGNPYLRLSLLSRNITSPLAMAISSILGANASLAVSFVVITGVFGANFGASILDTFGIKDAVARGLGMGAAAHGLGTAAIVDEKDAFPFSAIAMALTASSCTVLVSISVIRRLVLQLALG